MLKIISLLLLLLLNFGNALAEQTSEQTVAQTTAPSISDARALIDRGLDNDAIGVLGQLLSTSPDNFQAWFLLGVTQAKQRRFHDAIASFGKVVALQPKLAEPHNNLAVIYNELGDFRAAVKELEASLKLKPDYATAHENIGDLYVKLAADAYRKALKENGRPALRQRYERLLHIRKPYEVVADTQPEAAALPNTAQQPAAKQDQALIEASTASKSNVMDTIAQQGLESAVVDAKQAAPVQQSSIPAVVLDTEKQAIAAQGNSANKPEPQRIPKASSAQSDIEAAMAALEAWRSAWNRQDVPAYFTSYSDVFDVGARFKSLEQWKRYKQWVITKRAFIRVTLENIGAKKLPDGEIRLVFLQHFRSDSFNSDDIKEMLLRQSQHGWKIVYEASK